LLSCAGDLAAGAADAKGTFMSETKSTMLELGSRAPDFRLPDPDGKTYALKDFQGAPALLVAFICNHCPYVKHIRQTFASLAREYQQKGAAIVAINPNDARAYRAACTPDLFLFDGERRLVYRGQFDGSRPGNDAPVTGEDLAAALDAVLAGRPVSEDQQPSVGCNIKWKPGREPDYFR
jgi:thiol-disulfide isomerase/thioredoxin